jgi:hypothetical protein
MITSCFDARLHGQKIVSLTQSELIADQRDAGLQARQRPVLDRFGRRQRAQEVAEIVRERMKLEPHRVSGERPARQPRPLARAFAFLDPLFARAACGSGRSSIRRTRCRCGFPAVWRQAD